MSRRLWPKLDPLKFGKFVWPSVQLFDKQREIVYSVEDNDETFVPAGNKLGKDFDAAFIGTNLFLRCLKEGRTCRILNTSVAEHHLNVVWGETSRFLTMERDGGFAAIPLLAKDGGPLVVNYMEIRRKSEMVAKNPLNYLVGRVSEKGEGLAGHHADVTLLIGDESSGLVKKVREMGQGWADSMLWIGNCNPESGQGFFKEEIAKGDLLASDEPQLVET